MDAAIIFADLLLPVEPMGLKLRFAAGEGPVIDNPVRTSSDIDSLSISNTDDLGYVGESIQMVVQGAGRTRAGDRIRGRAVHHGQLHDRRRAVAQFHPHQADDVSRRDAVAPADGQAGGRAGRRSRVLQVAAGARIIQVFDSWVGALGPDDYVRFVAPYSRALIERIRAAGVPVIHFGTGAAGFFRELHAAGGDVMGVDWRINIDQAWMDISYRSAVQGNLDPAVLFAPLAGAADAGA